MGIPSYFTHVIKKHNNIIKQYNKSDIINYLFLDCNSIIYDCAYETKNQSNDETFEDTIISNVCEKILYYIKFFNPQKKTFIAFDGVAPIAKLNQQRSRRHKNTFIKKIEHSQKNKNSNWNTVKITPGTNFMQKLNKKIYSFFDNDNVVVSASDNHKEGEHKLFEYIRNNLTIKDNCIVYGLDADLIMLSLIHLKYCNIFLYRETPDFIKSIDSSLDPNKIYKLDIPLLYNNLKTEYNLSNINDYIFICFMLGNDFIPHMPSINIRTNGMTQLLECYNNLNLTFISENNNINWYNFKQFIRELAKLELHFYEQEYDIRLKMHIKKSMIHTKDKNEKLLNIPILEREREIYINPGEDGWQYRYYKVLFDIEYNNDLIKYICLNYLEALEWTYHYYTMGCKDWRWCYHYEYPPLLEDLVKYIPLKFKELITKTHENPIHVNTQLSYVTPKELLSDILPKNTYKKIQPYIDDFYIDTSSIVFNWSFCKYFWECHVKLPHININKLQAIVC